MKFLRYFVLTSFSALFSLGSFAQQADTLLQKLTIEDLFKLATDSNQQIQVARLGVEVAQKRTEVARTARNPVIQASATANYIGDATIYDQNLQNKITVPMPHFGNTFSFQASQLVFKGGQISNSIAVSNLQQQIASLGFQRNIMDVKLLLAGNYFDLFRLQNQKDVYVRNINLAKLRIGNVEKMYKLGMVTRNDLIRNELLIVNLSTAVQQIDNNISILNQQLDIALGLPRNVKILPDTSILTREPKVASLQETLEFAFQHQPDLFAAKVGTDIAKKNVSIAKADRLPALSLVAANQLARPITNAAPARDMYSNGWQAGLGISYNISSLYNSRKSISLAKTQLEQQRESEELQAQNLEIAVKSSYIKYQDALQLRRNAEKSLQLAQENFRIVEKKYLNQMAVLTDLLDATNAKLEAELSKEQSQINVLYTYYQLQKAIGNL